jgi:hypothetical protein
MNEVGGARRLLCNLQSSNDMVRVGKSNKAMDWEWINMGYWNMNQTMSNGGLWY